MDQRRWGGRFFGLILILAISLWKGFSKFWDGWREDCLCSEQDHPEFLVQEEGKSRGAESPKEDGFLRGRQIALMIYDYFWVSGAHDTVLDYADLFSVTLHDDNIQEFGTRGGRSSTVSVKDSIRCLWKSVQENTWSWAAQNCIGIVRHGDSSGDIDAQLSSWKTWWREVQIGNFDCETLTPGTGELRKEQW